MLCFAIVCVCVCVCVCVRACVRTRARVCVVEFCVWLGLVATKEVFARLGTEVATCQGCVRVASNILCTVQGATGKNFAEVFFRTRPPPPLRGYPRKKNATLVPGIIFLVAPWYGVFFVCALYGQLEP